MKEKTCLLCKKPDPNKTGSHIIPNFLIQSSFAEGKSKGRGNELIFRVSVTADFLFGRTSQEKIENAIGRPPTEEEIDKNTAEPIPYIKDYIFCKNCEDRLGVIESLYSNVISQVKGHNSLEEVKIEKQLSHLFWLSVIWRISATDFGFRFCSNTGIEEKMRMILDNCLRLKAEDIPDSGEYIEQLSQFSYYLIKFEEDNQKRGSYISPVAEQIGAFSPFIINNYVFIFSPLTGEERMVVPSYLGLENSLRTDYLNTGEKGERCLCLDTSTFEATIRKSVLFHRERMPFEIGILISDFWGEECPLEFAKEVFGLYIRDITSPSDKQGMALLRTLTNENLAYAYERIFEAWKAAGKLPSSVEHLPNNS